MTSLWDTDEKHPRQVSAYGTWSWVSFCGERFSPEGQHSKARVPVVTELGPVIVGLLIGISDEPDTFDLLVTVLGGRVQPQRSAMILRQRAAAHFRNQQRLRMQADLQIVTDIVVAVGRLHVPVAWQPSVGPFLRWVGRNQVC